MKTMKKTIFALLMLVTLSVFANDISIEANNNNGVVIKVNNVVENKNIKIYDENGTILFSEMISTTDYLKVFNLNAFSKGQYFIEYENDNKITTAIVEKSDNGIEVISNFNEITFKPIVNQNGNYVNIGFTNPKRQDVDIIVYDIDDFELVKVEDLNDLFVKKTFNTIKLPEGDYTIKVKSGENTFSKVITVK
jgi:hypothetical protein